MKGFGAILRSAREAKGLSQEELAERITQSKSTVSRLETEETEPDAEQINALTLHLSLSPATLLEGMGIRLDVPPAARLPKEFVEDYLALPADVRQVAHSVVRAMRQSPGASE